MQFVRYVGRRVAHGLLVIVLVTTTVFFVTRVIGDPVRLMLPVDATQQQYDALERSLGLEAPLLAQFRDYVADVARFRLGDSYWQRTSVSGLIADRLPNTLLLTATAIAVAFLLGSLIGIGASRRAGSWVDKTLSSAALVGLSVPHFWLGSMLILLGAVVLGWFPTSGKGGIEHLVLPVATLALPAIGRIAQITRTSMLREFASPYVRTARSKGLRESYIVVRHALRNAMVPIFTLTSWEGIYALGVYSIVVEVVFAWPGLGQLVIQAIQRQDLILVQGIVMLLAFSIVLINLVTDLMYRLIDPRIELG
jgi:peptide/nickel transport system permease protein